MSGTSRTGRVELNKLIEVLREGESLVVTRGIALLGRLVTYKTYCESYGP